MTPQSGGPRVGELVVVHGPLARVVELTDEPAASANMRDGVPGAVVTDGDLTAWVPLAWLILVPLDGAR